MEPPDPGLGDLWQDTTSGTVNVGTRDAISGVIEWQPLATADTALPVGTIIDSVEEKSTMEAKGWLALDGTVISEDMYANLFKLTAMAPWISGGTAPHRTMTLPNLDRRFRLTDFDDTGKISGANQKVISLQNMPRHDHDVTVDRHGDIQPTGQLTGMSGPHSHPIIGDGMHDHDVYDQGHTHDKDFIVVSTTGGSMLDGIINDRSHTERVTVRSTTATGYARIVAKPADDRRPLDPGRQRLSQPHGAGVEAHRADPHRAGEARGRGCPLRRHPCVLHRAQLHPYLRRNDMSDYGAFRFGRDAPARIATTTQMLVESQALLPGEPTYPPIPFYPSVVSGTGSQLGSSSTHQTWANQPTRCDLTFYQGDDVTITLAIEDPTDLTPDFSTSWEWSAQIRAIHSYHSTLVNTFSVKDEYTAPDGQVPGFSTVTMFLPRSENVYVGRYRWDLYSKSPFTVSGLPRPPDVPDTEPWPPEDQIRTWLYGNVTILPRVTSTDFLPEITEGGGAGVTVSPQQQWIFVGPNGLVP